jgi:hypothetical protein
MNNINCAFLCFLNLFSLISIFRSLQNKRRDYGEEKKMFSLSLLNFPSHFSFQLGWIFCDIKMRALSAHKKDNLISQDEGEMNAKQKNIKKNHENFRKIAPRFAKKKAFKMKNLLFPRKTYEGLSQ